MEHNAQMLKLMEQMEAIDIDALNSAIADLSSVVGPLADLVENLSFF